MIWQVSTWILGLWMITSMLVINSLISQRERYRENWKQVSEAMAKMRVKLMGAQAEVSRLKRGSADRE